MQLTIFINSINLVNLTFSPGASLKHNPSLTKSFERSPVNSCSRSTSSFYLRFMVGAIAQIGAFENDLANPKSSLSRNAKSILKILIFKQSIINKLRSH